MYFACIDDKVCCAQGDCDAHQGQIQECKPQSEVQGCAGATGGEVWMKAPVPNVSWSQAKVYADWLGKKLKGKIRLPSEAEWEYAARKQTTDLYYWGPDVGVDKANCKECSDPPWLRAVEAFCFSKYPSPFGLLNTAGNVSEWVQDCWFPNHTGRPPNLDARTECSETTWHVIRGGSYDNKAIELRSTYRFPVRAESPQCTIGFRLVQELP
jgi:formylglycine-generating enzyme required for sulfatase activity